MYEIYFLEYPFPHNNTHEIIYLMGNGIIRAPHEYKMDQKFRIVLMKCWRKNAGNRTNFKYLVDTFRNLPKTYKFDIIKKQPADEDTKETRRFSLPLDFN